ncbi:MAG: orotate phosphoribosyltransferase [Proteobacteria bacterium]|nr:orotate phosphoribosyltransferase [Pseudomonadota bacterium]
MSINKTAIIDDLIAIGAVKFGEFVLKSGIKSPIYLDLRLIISYPDLLTKIAAALMEISRDLSFQRIAGIPYTALPIATAFSLQSGKPMIYARKEVKDYGTAKQVEGIWQEGESVLVVDDLITDGGSKLETFTTFENQGLKISDVVVLIDREQGGKERLEKKGYHLFSIISIFEILDRMKETNRIVESEYQNIKQFLTEHR